MTPQNNPLHWRFWLTEVRSGWGINPAMILSYAGLGLTMLFLVHQ